MANRTLRQRRKIFIDPAVQGAIVRQSLIHWLTALAVASLCLFMLQVLWDGVDKSFSHHLSTLWGRYGMVLVVMICMFPVFAYDSIRLSHRFAGPIFALRVALRKLADGQRIPEVTFRKNDFWNELSRDVNQIAARLDQQTLSRQPVGVGQTTQTAAHDDPSHQQPPAR
jgi:hypothetical protein